MMSPQIIYLDGAINEILAAIKLSPIDCTDRYQVIQKLLAVLDSSSSLRGSCVEPYGSFGSHLSPSWGDLEISINLPIISSMSDIQALQSISQLLHEKDGWHIKRGVSYVKEIGILRVNHGNISCDMSVNNWIGQVRSNIFRLISQMDDRYPQMVLLVKEWSRAKDICYSEKKIINSYCLTLLVIFHFQTCEPAILPSFKDLYPGSVAEDLSKDRNSDAVRRISEIYANNVTRWRSNKLKRPTNFSSVSELWLSFVEKLSKLDRMAQSYQICTFTGQWEEKCAALYQDSCELIVKDPFDEKENVGSAIRSLSKLCDAFKSTYYTLITSTSQDHLVADLSTLRPMAYPFSQ